VTVPPWSERNRFPSAADVFVETGTGDEPPLCVTPDRNGLPLQGAQRGGRSQDDEALSVRDDGVGARWAGTFGRLDAPPETFWYAREERQAPVGQRLGLDAIKPDRSLAGDLLLERQGLLANEEPVARRRVASALGEPVEKVRRHLPAARSLGRHEPGSLGAPTTPHEPLRVAARGGVDGEDAAAGAGGLGDLPVRGTDGRLRRRCERNE